MSKTNIILIENDSYALAVNLRGGGIAQFYAKKPLCNIIYGYNDNSKQDGCMGDVLFPWAGRVENKEYRFEGQKYKLSSVTQSGPHGLHGFAKDQPFILKNKTRDSATLEYKFNSIGFLSKGYPFDTTISLEYSVIDNGFSVHTIITNDGDKTLPFGLGFHPYFCLESQKIDDLELEIPAKSLVEFDENLKPTGNMLDIANTGMDFSRTAIIGNKEIDNCFTNLKYKDGEATTILRNPNNGREIRVIQDKKMPYMQVYSSDTIKKENYRRAIALEPQTCCGYALNIPNMGLSTLKPAEHFECNWRVEIDCKK